MITVAALASLRLMAEERGTAAGPVATRHLPSGAEVVPQLELLSGVLAHTDWIKRRGPRGEPSRYFKELHAWFAPFRTHHAIKQAAELTRRGFTSDAPPAFALHLGALPELPMAYRYSEYLIKRADGRAILEEFRQALGDLARESDFARFLSGHKKDYDRWCGDARFERSKAVQWLERFYGAAGYEFRLALAPAMYPGGGYGASIAAGEGRTIVYQVVRVQKDEKGEPVFPKNEELLALSLHEWGHAYVNPALETHADRVRRLEPLFLPVKEAMRKQSYPTVAIFMNEQVLRAATLLAWATDGVLPAREAAARLAYEERRGFYLTAKVCSWLKEDYLANRNRYEDFAAYVPSLLDRFEAEVQRSKEKAPGSAAPSAKSA